MLIHQLLIHHKSHLDQQSNANHSYQCSKTDCHDQNNTYNFQNNDSQSYDVGDTVHPEILNFVSEVKQLGSDEDNNK